MRKIPARKLPFQTVGAILPRMKSGKQTSAIEFYALAFGFFLGLAILKFGNPVILDSKITPPN